MNSIHNRKPIIVTILTFACQFLTLFNSNAEVPRHIAYQGLLKDLNGAPLAAPVDLVIRLYDSEIEGNLLFEEEHKQIQLTNGVYSIQIGEGFDPGTNNLTGGIPNSVLDGSTLWLGEAVNDSDELTPRLSIGASIFSLKSQFSEQLVLPGTSSPAVFIDSQGQVGIGNQPTMSLDLNTSSLYGRPAIGGSSQNHWAYLHISSVHSLIWDSGADMRFGTEPEKGSGYIERMRITKDGLVGIGTTPTMSLDVTTPSIYGAPAIGGTVKDAWAYLHISSAPSLIWNSGTVMRLGTETDKGKGYSEKMRITSNGNVGIGANGLSEKLEVAGGILCSSGTACNSDLRWKKNIYSIDNGLRKVSQLRGVEYEWKTDEFPDKNFKKGKQIGFIAQEIEEILPEVVRTDGEGFKSLDYARLTAVLVEAVKDLKAENNELKEKVENLENLSGRIAALEEHLSFSP